MLTITLSGCSGLTGIAASALTGGGPSVAANVQAGKTNSQTVGSSSVVENKAEEITTNTTTNQQLPEWVWVVFLVLFVVGWTTDTPGTMLKGRKK